MGMKKIGIIMAIMVLAYNAQDLRETKDSFCQFITERV